MPLTGNSMSGVDTFKNMVKGIFKVSTATLQSYLPISALLAHGGRSASSCYIGGQISLSGEVPNVLQQFAAFDRVFLRWTVLLFVCSSHRTLHPSSAGLVLIVSA